MIVLTDLKYGPIKAPFSALPSYKCLQIESAIIEELIVKILDAIMRVF
jgi:hypothetical protein